MIERPTEQTAVSESVNARARFRLTKEARSKREELPQKLCFCLKIQAFTKYNPIKPGKLGNELSNRALPIGWSLVAVGVLPVTLPIGECNRWSPYCDENNLT